MPTGLVGAGICCSSLSVFVITHNVRVILVEIAVSSTFLMAEEEHNMRDLNPPGGVALAGYNALRGEMIQHTGAALPTGSTSSSGSSRRSSNASSKDNAAAVSEAQVGCQAKRQRVGGDSNVSSPMELCHEVVPRSKVLSAT